MERANMNTRHLMLMLFVLTMPICRRGVVAAEAPSRPNILFIMADQFRRVAQPESAGSRERQDDNTFNVQSIVKRPLQ